jgi:uracil-DNA glycosylase
MRIIHPQVFFLKQSSAQCAIGNAQQHSHNFFFGKKMEVIHASWMPYLQEVMATEDFKKLQERIENIRKEKTVYPPAEQVYTAFQLPFDDVKVVILGQDPYFGEGQAHGLSFSVQAGTQAPPSLINILKEANVIGRKQNGDLTGWMEQGVLLLNSVLTVEAGKPRSHMNLGWQLFTSLALNALISREHMVFVCWGRDAQSIVPVPFNGCNHFARINEYLNAHGMPSIDWSL